MMRFHTLMQAVLYVRLCHGLGELWSAVCHICGIECLCW